MYYENPIEKDGEGIFEEIWSKISQVWVIHESTHPRSSRNSKINSKINAKSFIHGHIYSQFLKGIGKENLESIRKGVTGHVQEILKILTADF